MKHFSTILLVNLRKEDQLYRTYIILQFTEYTVWFKSDCYFILAKSSSHLYISISFLVGSKGCETSVTSETDSVDPEEQKDGLDVDAATKECHSDTPQLSVIEGKSS